MKLFTNKDHSRYWYVYKGVDIIVETVNGIPVLPKHSTATFVTKGYRFLTLTKAKNFITETYPER